MTLLDVRGLEVAYGAVTAVRDVSLSVDAGQVLAVLGANGAGKTTTLRAVSGLVPARSGQVLVDGTDVTGRAPEDVARLGVAHVPAGRGVFGGLSVADNLRMGLYGAGSDRTGKGAAAVEEVLALFPVLDERRAQPAGTMSGGQQQQLAVARALVQRPRVLLLDEMSMGLAPAVVADLFRTVAALRDQGMAVVLVEQFVGRALEVADRAVVLEQGRVVAAGSPADLTGDALAAAYLGGGGRTGELPGAPDRARERVSVRLRGRDVRRLEELAAARGQTVQEALADLVETSLPEGSP